MKIIHEKNKDIYEVKQKMKDEKKRNENWKLQKEIEIKEKNLKEYYNEIKSQSEKYKTEKYEKEKKERIELEKELSLKQKKLKDEIKNKLPTIMQRQTKAQDVFVGMYKAKENKLLEQEENMKRLNIIVENLKVRPKIEIDSQRVKKLTENLKLRYSAKQDEDYKVVLFPNHGFTIDKLMSDLRYKISTALGEAGLLQKEYTKDFLKNLYSDNKNV